MRRLGTQALELLVGFESQLYHTLAVQPKATYGTSLCFSFLFCDNSPYLGKPWRLAPHAPLVLRHLAPVTLTSLG